MSVDKYFHGKIMVPYRHVAGAYVGRFIQEIGNNRKIMGVKCSKCGKVYVPPRMVCFECFEKMDDWVEVGKQGTVKGFTVVTHETAVMPLKPPFAYGIIELDDSNTGFVHIIKESDPSKLKIGMKVEAVFKDNPEGNILDIEYFKPV
ncbi:MAG: Zn-ribbon domain-containing OB-fold protein [Candidatus Lokiarchaeia archaeon]